MQHLIEGAASRHQSPFFKLRSEGALIGIELLDPEKTTVEAINDVLKQHGLDAIRESDLKPILAA